MQKIIQLTIILLIIVFFSFGCIESNDLNNNNNGIEHSGGESSGLDHETTNILDLPHEDISAEELIALEEAINDEYNAFNIYTKVIEDFGEVRPFSNIVNAEQQHINELKSIYLKYSLEFPSNPQKEGPAFDSVVLACEAAEQAEIYNVAIYDRLFSQVDNQDIIMIFEALRYASQEKHLPAFQRCSGLR